MKHIKKFEIGDASSSPYYIDKIDEDYMGYNYFFTTDSGLRYCVTYQNITNDALLYSDILNVDFIDDFRVRITAFAPKRKPRFFAGDGTYSPV